MQHPKFFTLFLLLILSSFHTSAHADLSKWEAEPQDYPKGMWYTKGNAKLMRYSISSLNEASNNLIQAKQSPEQRMEMALSVVELDMPRFKMTRLFGMPAATGTASGYDGPVSFAASFSGRRGSARETVSFFVAPSAEFERYGGIAMLENNPPGIGGIGESSAKTVTAAAPKAQVKKKQTQTHTKKQHHLDGPSLLAGIKGDMDKIETETTAKQRAATKQAEMKKAQAIIVRRAQLYKASGARKGFYPAPSNQEEHKAWPLRNHWNVQVPHDPRSPRHITITVNKALSPNQTLNALVKKTRLNLTAKPRFEVLESYRELDGRDFRLLLAPTQMESGPGVAFGLYSRLRGDDEAHLFLMEMPKDIYQQWGGAAGMLHMRGVIPSANVFPKAERNRIAQAPLPQQVALYETVLDKFYMTQSLLLMQTKARTVMMMQELNYDLLFGDDIGSPFIAD